MLEQNKLRWYEKLACFWPMGLVFVSGAVGGVFGGVAATLNVRIFKKDWPDSKKYLFSLLSGLGAILIYFVIVVSFALFFPRLFY